ncbi:MAG: pyridoxamine 5'-phosphate oxidase family protein [Candidatus Eremiobacteraeota bacterium]|nr:pyridoxamine 5'-phosphate oxidase family protein [Candidatus Eremiobacteraeota bacterium]
MTKVMEKEEIRTIIKDIIHGSNTACLATVDGDKPWVRYIMAYNSGDNLQLFCSTSLKSRKVKQIKENPNIHLTTGWDHANNQGPYIQFSGKAEIHSDAETKKKHWHPMLEQFFQTPDNPNYCIIEFSPDNIEICGYSENPMETITYTP